MKTRFKIFFFTQYFSIGLLGPYFALFLIEKEYSGSQIGLMLGVLPVAGLVFQPVWSLLSDILNRRRILLVIGSIGLVIASIGLGFSNTFAVTFLWGILFSAMRAPISPISTAIALDYLEDQGESETYGLLRLWGSLGFAVSSLLMAGFFLDDIRVYFPWFAAGIFFILASLSFLLPERAVPYTYSGFKGLRYLAKNAKFILFLAASIFIGGTQGIYNNYLTLFLQSLDTASWLIGAIVSLQALIEIPMMMVAPYLIQRFSLQWLIVAGAVAFPVRWLLFFFIEEPAWIIPLQLLHGVGVISFFVVAVSYIDKLINPKWRATGQALYSTAMMGIGSGLGVFFAGIIIERYSVRSVWILSLVLGLIGLGLLLLDLYRDKSPADPVER